MTEPSARFTDALGAGVVGVKMNGEQDVARVGETITTSPIAVGTTKRVMAIYPLLRHESSSSQ
jgi:hypothetical protein